MQSLFYPSKVGRRFGTDMQPFERAAYYRVWNNMQSLLDRGLDPLTVLIDRAREKGMECFSSLRLGAYGGMNPDHVADDTSGASAQVHARPAMMRAAAANFWDKGVDGLHTWFMRWPLGDAQHRTLTELGDPEQVKEADKHYVLRKRTECVVQMGYDAAVPVELPAPDPGRKAPIRFHIADDIDGSAGRIRQVQLRLNIANLLSDDALTISLNGQSLVGETCLRHFGRPFDPYGAQWIEFHLRTERPQKGENVLEISLDRRPAGMVAGITVEQLQIIVEYGSYPST